MKKRKKKSFREMSTAEKAGVALAITGALGSVARAQRDISKRDSDEVRGSKLLWRLACLNVLGVRAYYWFGRRSPKA